MISTAWWKLLRRMRQPEPIEDLRALCITIARNAGRDLQRRAATHRRHEPGLQLAWDVPEPGAEERVAAQQIARRTLERMRPIDQAVVQTSPPPNAPPAERQAQSRAWARFRRIEAGLGG